MRKTKEHKEQTLVRILVRTLLPLVLKFAIIQLLSKAAMRSYEQSRKTDPMDPISVLKAKEATIAEAIGITRRASAEGSA